MNTRNAKGKSKTLDWDGIVREKDLLDHLLDFEIARCDEHGLFTPDVFEWAGVSGDNRPAIIAGWKNRSCGEEYQHVHVVHLAEHIPTDDELLQMVDNDGSGEFTGPLQEKMQQAQKRCHELWVGDLSSDVYRVDKQVRGILSAVAGLRSREAVLVYETEQFLRVTNNGNDK